jgi:hypothetical protein
MTLVEAIEAYLKRYQHTTTPVSIRDAAEAIRRDCPDAEHTDGGIADLVASEAVRRSLPVFLTKPSQAKGS